MRRKSSSASRVRLSPNEEAQLVREELESRRKLRLQQVREQERYIARQVRRQVQERRQRQLQMLADSLQLEWQQQHTHKLQALSRLYQHNLKSVGHGHRSAEENEPDLEALAQKSVERQERAEERHREALRELSARRHDEEQQRCRHIEARRKALVEEKKRAVRVASLPPPPPNPVESIGKTTARPLKSAAAAERFSVTHCHMPQTAVDRETHTEQQPSAQQAAALEFQRLEELWREEARDRQEQLEKARLRGNHALQREQNTQDRARLLCELERLQQVDLLRRRQAVNSVPAQIFQPLYRQEELRDEQQRDLEIAFQDVYTEERKVKGDLVLQLVPEPLPPLSAASHDEELDVTLDPECAPEGEEPDTPVTEAPDPGRGALRRLLDRIRSQRARQRAAATTPSHEGDAEVEVLSVETGSLSSQEKAPEGSSEEQTPSPTHTDDGADVSDEAVVAGTLLPPEERDQPMPASAVSERRATHEELLLRRQQEQLAVLEELEQKRRELEQRLRETQQMSKTLQEAAQRRPVIQESAELPEPPPEVDSDDLHTQRLHQYQQRLLQQNRLHKKSVEEARRRLQEYQHSLKLRYGIGSTTAARATLQQPSVSSETAGDGTRASLPLIFNPDACAAHPGNAPASQFPAPPVQTQALFSPPKPVGSDSSRPSVLSEGPPLEARAQDGQEGHVPLPPPAVVLELLRSRLQQAACAMPQPADITGSVTAPSSGPAGPVQREEEADRQETVRRHMRRQRDALQALITADVQASVSDSSGAQVDQMILNTLLNAIEEANRPPAAPIQQDGATLSLSNDGVYDTAPVNRGRVKPPVSRPPARLAFLRQMEQHELSAIQEVDTPVNISLDTELQSAADVSESSSAPLPALTSDGSHSPSDRSQVTGRISRMSWREMLLQDSTPSRGPSSVNPQQQEERFSAGCPSSVDPDYLSSTTISTGSYFTSDHEPDDSHLCIDPDEYGLSPADRSHEMSGSVQQIIDKYSKELNASLRHAGVHAGAVNSECQSWSSVLHEEARAHDGDAAQISDAFLPLQPHPDIDSSSSSSSRNAVRDDQSSRAQGWSETVNRILERLSDQLSLGHDEQAHSSAPSEPSRLSSSPCTDQDRASDSSHLTNESLQSMMNGAGHVSNYSDSHSSAELQDHSASRQRFDGGQSVLSQLIGRASDIGSSQVFDQSSALAGGLQEVTQSTAAIPGPELRSGPDRPSEIRSLMSPALRHPDEDRSAFTDAPHDDASDLFLPLPSDVTNNESVDRSTALCIPLEAEKCGTDASVDDASDWLESSDQSLPSLQHLRTDTPIQSQADLQISMEQLSLTHESLCETDVVADPTVMDVSRMPRSPLKTCLQGESLTPTVQLPSQEVTSATPQHQSAVEENALSEFLERAQAAGDMKGILEESTISFISLPESTLQDPDLTEDSGSEPQEVRSDHSEGKASSRTVEDSQLEDPEPSFPHAVMLLEFQCSPAQRQRRDGLAQRSALRAAQIKVRHSTTRLEQHASRATGRTALKSDTADGLKSVAEVRICTAAQRRVEEAEMHRRTERLYSQLEEVKRQKEFRSRQESYAKNREKARDFQRKTLEKLRARLKP
ncbi:uncharacterized protein cep295 isoform X2 [Chanodichthys erythropterus]|uniref:uncharacterized protein cep295 isoform X2 n=1 Tax=Chanodichthys erythropterus TaxID=933992 RepID=UPI00351E3B8A